MKLTGYYEIIVDGLQAKQKFYGEDKVTPEIVGAHCKKAEEEYKKFCGGGTLNGVPISYKFNIKADKGSSESEIKRLQNIVRNYGGQYSSLYGFETNDPELFFRVYNSVKKVN